MKPYGTMYGTMFLARLRKKKFGSILYPKNSSYNSNRSISREEAHVVALRFIVAVVAVIWN